MSDLYKTKRGQKMSECAREGRMEGIPGHTRGSSKKKRLIIYFRIFCLHLHLVSQGQFKIKIKTHCHTRKM